MSLTNMASCAFAIRYKSRYGIDPITLIPCLNMPKHILTASQVKAATHNQDNGKPKKYNDGDGLYLIVFKTGAKSWRYDYQFAKKRRTLTYGSYPVLSLAAARELHREAVGNKQKGFDPAILKQETKHCIEEQSFQAFAELWLEEQKEGWSVTHYQRTASYFERDVYPAIGKIAVSAITVPMILEVIKRISRRGADESARKTKQSLQQVFDYAVIHGQCTHNPARDINLSLVLPKRIKKHFASIKC